LDFVSLNFIVLSMTINLNDKFSAKKAASLCGFGSVAMLDYLQRTGIFVPNAARKKQRGKSRSYSFRDLLVLKAIKRLLDSGASVANLKTSLEEFQKRKWTADVVSLEDKDGIIRYLIVSADSIFLKKDANTLIDLSHKGQLTFSFIVDLDNLHSELRKDMGLKVVEQQELDFLKVS
jgi:DNA-binding transcriptional MerR regulator